MNESIGLLFGKLSNIFGIIVLLLITIEWIILWVSNKMESHKEGWVNLFSYALESIPYLFLGRIVIFGSMLFIYQYRIFTLGFEWYVWILAYFLYDFMFYVVHFFGHQMRFFWCIHGVHHTAKEMKLTVAVRGSFLGFLHSPHTVIWLPILGFDPYIIFIVEAIARLYGLYEHASEKLIGKQKWMEFFFITPSAHRVHHARNHIYLDRNYGETFSIWDRFFGTFQTELNEIKPDYGIMDDKIDSKSLWQVQLLLWKDLWIDIKKAPKIIHKIKYIIMPPGWNHIDGGKFASSYRAEARVKYHIESKINLKKAA